MEGGESEREHSKAGEVAGVVAEKCSDCVTPLMMINAQTKFRHI